MVVLSLPTGSRVSMGRLQVKCFGCRGDGFVVTRVKGLTESGCVGMKGGTLKTERDE